MQIDCESNCSTLPFVQSAAHFFAAIFFFFFFF